MAKKQVDLLIKKASELLTLRGGSETPVLGKHMRNLGIIKDGALAIDEGKIVAVGRTSQLEGKFSGRETVDAENQVVMPGFVDPHTHLVFAGSREEEFEMRLQGASYIEILQKGGGILNTVAQTRKASFNRLFENCGKTLDIMLEHGTTTVEAKSGYGLTLNDEVKCLKVMKRLDNEHPVDVVSTFLGAHAVPPEYEGRTDDYVKFVIKKMIPAVASRRLAEFCDVFCEKGVFNMDQSKMILLSGRKHDLTPKLHTDEMAQLGGAELAAEIGAISAEHLLFSSEDGLRMMAKQGVVAVLLPAAAFSLMMGRYADARTMIRLGVPVALGTDFN
ncbi:MAG: imidazolonepropionase, partial [Candidatus Bathyarchaeia archaeon]